MNVVGDGLGLFDLVLRRVCCGVGGMTEVTGGVGAANGGGLDGGSIKLGLSGVTTSSTSGEGSLKVGLGGRSSTSGDGSLNDGLGGGDGRDGGGGGVFTDAGISTGGESGVAAFITGGGGGGTTG